MLGRGKTSDYTGVATMIDISKWSDDTLETLAKIADEDGRKDDARSIRAILERRKQDDKQLEELIASGLLWR